MMIRWKIDIWQALTDAGMNSYKARQEKAVSQDVMGKLRRGDTNVTLKTVGWLCEILGKQPGDLLECPEVEPIEKYRLKDIKDIEFGTTVELGGMEMTVLDHEHNSTGKRINGVLCLAKSVLFEMPFDENEHNDWNTSSLRKYLNGEYYKQVLDKNISEALIPFVRDLSSDDGLKDYGSCIDCVSLISCEEYRKYRSRIEVKEKPWWTLTAYSADTENYYKFQVCGVKRIAGGIDIFHSNGEDGGVVPLFLIAPNTKVKIAED